MEDERRQRSDKEDEYLENLEGPRAAAGGQAGFDPGRDPGVKRDRQRERERERENVLAVSVLLFPPPVGSSLSSSA